MKRNKMRSCIAALMMLAMLFTGCASGGDQNSTATNPAVDETASVQTQVPETNEVESVVSKADVIIVGGGVTGMMAAIEFAENYPDTKVILLEKSRILGGNLPYTGGALQGFHKDTYPAAPAAEEYVNYFEDIRKYSVECGLTDNFEINTTLIKNVYGKAQDAFDTLRAIDVIPMTYNDTVFYTGSYLPFYHFDSASGGDGVGVSAVGFRDKLVGYIEKCENITVWYESEVTELQVNNGMVEGVIVNNGESQLQSSAVILATGSIANNEALMTEYLPEYVGMVNVTTGLSTGSAITLTREFETPVVGNEAIGAIISNDSTMIPLQSHFMINETGRRIINEMDPTFDYTSYVQIYGKNHSKIVSVLCDQAYIDAHPDEVKTKMDEGTLRSYDTLEALAVAEGIDVTNLLDEVAKYNQAVIDQVSPGFELPAEYAHALSKAPYYVETLGVFAFETFVGIKINENAQVLDGAGNVVPGLYAAGQCVIGNITDYVYGQDGTGITWSSVSGRYAASVIAEGLKK